MSRPKVIGLLALVVGLGALGVWLAPRLAVPYGQEGRSAEAGPLAVQSPPGDGAAEVPLRLPLENPRIVIIKSTRRLFLYSGGRAVRQYRIGLGFAPVGDKTREGDGRTPEGEYYICNKNPNSRFYLSLGLSYPNEQDAARGLEEGLISESDYRRIVRAIRIGTTPPWDTPLGGEIFIHGRGGHRDWTLGCIALDDGEMHVLYEAVPRETPVVIQP